MVSYLLFNKAGPKHCFTRWPPPVDVVSVQVWGTLFVSDHEGGVPTRSVKRSKPPLWFPYPLRPENQTTQITLLCLASSDTELCSKLQLLSSSLFCSQVSCKQVNKSKQSILECSCAKKTACPNQNLLILFLNYNIISMGELHSLLLHGTKRNDQTIQEFKMQRLHYINYKQLGHPKYFDISKSFKVSMFMTSKFNCFVFPLCGWLFYQAKVPYKKSCIFQGLYIT